MHGGETAVSFDIHGLDFSSFIVCEETGLALGVNLVVTLHIELLFIILKWFHIKVLHLIQSLEDIFWQVISWELRILFVEIVFINFLESFNQFEIRTGPEYFAGYDK